MEDQKMKMSDDAFARLVAEEVKNKVSRSQRSVLLEKENWDKWKRALLSLIKSLQSQLDNIADDEESDRDRYAELGPDGTKLLALALSEYRQRRTKIERFKFHVERRLDDVEQMIHTGEVIQVETQSNAVLYENAIRKHKEMIEMYDIEPTVIDMALWDALEGQWTFNKIRADQI
jgi:hypothetical protein